MCATDRQTSDKHRLMLPPYGAGGIINRSQIVGSITEWTQSICKLSSSQLTLKNCAIYSASPDVAVPNAVAL